MAKIRIRAPKSYNWLPRLDRQTNLFNDGSPARSTPDIEDTIGVSDPSNTKEYANWWMVLFSYVLIILGVCLGSWLASKAGTVTFSPGKDALDTIGFLALFFVMAQAIERFMEPITELNLKFIGSARKVKQNQRDQKIEIAEKATENTPREENANAAATKEAEANQIAANTKVFIWALASFTAMLVSGATKVYFLQAIGFNGVSEHLNILITGLVVGGGTKPLHDLIKLIEKKKETSSDEENNESESQ